MAKISIFIILFIPIIYAQNTLEGYVKNQKGEPIFAANIYPKGSQKGTISDFEGYFRFPVENEFDSLVVSFIGYQIQTIAFEHINFSKSLLVILQENEALLSEITIKARRVIAEEFSAIKISRLEIYTNPVANADPLRAITILPSSTNTGETANPELRGSSSGRSRVVLNRTPIYNPVRSAQINGLGFFSLFNTELIKNQIVYASNPPLVYGNSTGGLVELETIDELEKSQSQFSLSLASLGFLTSLKLSKKRNTDFIQFYGNYQFSKLYTGLNAEAFDFIDNFKTQDLGLNFHKTVNTYSSFNMYSYFIDENSDIKTNSFNYEALSSSSNTRNFTILNYGYQKKRQVFTLDIRTDIRQSNYNFGNSTYKSQQFQLYGSANYKYLFKNNITFQAGSSYELTDFQAQDTIPLFFFALYPEAPNSFLLFS